MKTALSLFSASFLLFFPQSDVFSEPIPASQDGAISEQAKLFIALLKRRAQRILEARKAPPPPLLSSSFGVSQGYESNVNLDGERRGDYFTEETTSLVFRPRITSWLRGDFNYDLIHSHFQELTDSHIWSNTFSGVVQFQPHKRFRTDLGYEYGILNFPLDSDSSFFDQRWKVRLSWAQTSWLTHEGGWAYQLREYDTRKARDTNQNQIPGQNRQDQRHSGSYELRFRFPRVFARLGAEFYRNFSNDHFQDFYDWNDFRVRGVLTKVFNPQWTGTFVASHERKNYQKRSVPAINVAERDGLLTLAASLICQLNTYTAITWSVTYRHQDSNDPRLDFTDWIHQVGVSFSF